MSTTLAPTPRVIVAPRQPEGRGPNGRRLCRWCHSEVPERRQSWCGDACVRAYQATTWPALSTATYDRDRGICQRCGVDTAAQHAAYMRWAYEDRPAGQPRVRADHDAFLAFHGVPPARGWGQWFDVDHIVPLADGGTNSLDNLRVLCCRCHRAVTAAWQRERARRSALDLFAAAAP